MKNKSDLDRLAKTLFGEDGVFEVTTPGGAVFHVRCQRGVGMEFTRVDRGESRKTREGEGWRIRRGAKANIPSNGA